MKSWFNFDLLLGWPFHCLISAMTEDFLNGLQTIALCDLNMGKQFTIPSWPWSEGCPHCRENKQCNSHQSIIEMGFEISMIHTLSGEKSMHNHFLVSLICLQIIPHIYNLFRILILLHACSITIFFLPCNLCLTHIQFPHFLMFILMTLFRICWLTNQLWRKYDQW